MVTCWLQRLAVLEAQLPVAAAELHLTVAAEVHLAAAAEMYLAAGEYLSSC